MYRCGHNFKHGARKWSRNTCLSIFQRGLNSEASSEAQLTRLLGNHPVATKNNIGDRISMERLRRLEFSLFSRIPLITEFVYRASKRANVWTVGRALNAMNYDGKELYYPDMFMRGVNLAFNNLIRLISGWVPESDPDVSIRSDDQVNQSLETEDLLKKMLTPNLFGNIKSANLRLKSIGLRLNIRLNTSGYNRVLCSFSVFGPEPVVTSTLTPRTYIPETTSIGRRFKLDVSEGYEVITSGFYELVVNSDYLRDKKVKLNAEYLVNFVENGGELCCFDVEVPAEYEISLSKIDSPSDVVARDRGIRPFYVRLETDYMDVSGSFNKWVIADIDNFVQDSIIKDSNDPLVENM